MDVFSDHFHIYISKFLFIFLLIDFSAWPVSNAQPSRSLVLPVMHRASPPPVREVRSTATTTLSDVVVDGSDSAPVSAFSSELITLREPFGQYFGVMSLGSPPAEVALIIDTGSEMVWVQCQPCRKCGVQVRDPIFDPSKSSTYRQLNCTSELCNDITGLAMGCSDSFGEEEEEEAMPKMCFYNATYGDNSVSFGALSVEKLTIPALDGKTLTLPEFVFGCGFENRGIETEFNASGIMGLDRGRRSAVSQLAAQKFSYCLPDRSNKIDATGFISFDLRNPSDVAVRQPESLPMKYATLFVNNKSQFYAQSYYVNLTGLRVGSLVVDMAAHADVDPTTGDGGTIIDTGTSLTALVGDAYVAFRDAVRRQVGGSARAIEIPELPGLDTCYSVAKRDGAPLAPDVALRFDGAGGAVDVEVVLPRQNVWLHVGRQGSRNIYCLAFSSASGMNSGGGGGRNVIGNFQQQDFVVEYDLWRERIGFGHLVECGAGGGDNIIAFPHNFSLIIFVSILLILSSS